MIVICEKCETRFHVGQKDGDEISEKGRLVRCSSCQHTWREGPYTEDNPKATIKEEKSGVKKSMAEKYKKKDEDDDKKDEEKKKIDNKDDDLFDDDWDDEGDDDDEEEDIKKPQMPNRRPAIRDNQGNKPSPAARPKFPPPPPPPPPQNKNRPFKPPVPSTKNKSDDLNDFDIDQFIQEIDEANEKFSGDKNKQATAIPSNRRNLTPTKPALSTTSLPKKEEKKEEPITYDISPTSYEEEREIEEQVEFERKNRNKIIVKKLISTTKSQMQDFVRSYSAPLPVKIAVLTLIFMAIISNLVSKREMLMSKYEFLKPVYNMMGLPETNGLFIKKVTFNSENKKIVVDLLIKNSANDARYIPDIKISFLDEDWNNISNLVFNVNGANKIKPDGKARITNKLQNIPKKTKYVTIEIGSYFEFFI